jgi:hypothetical protein
MAPHEVELEQSLDKSEVGRDVRPCRSFALDVQIARSQSPTPKVLVLGDQTQAGGMSEVSALACLGERRLP